MTDIIASLQSPVISKVELIYNPQVKPSERPLASSAHAAYKLMLASWDMNKIELQEQFRVMLLDRKNGCIGITTVSTGGISTCLVDLKLVFALACKAAASSIIIAHNHPSGNKQPSAADKTLTEKFVEAGKLLELPVLDHLIVTKDGYTSFADEGFMPGMR